MIPSAVIQAKDLAYSVKHKSLLNPLNCAFSQGHITGVLGPNGAGKTTLLKCLSAQLRGKGTVLLDGADIHQLSQIDVAKRIAVVNQLHDSVFALTTRQVVKMGLLPHKGLFSSVDAQDLAHIDACIEDVGLTDKQHQVFNQLSGGEQQRCLIAQALVQGAPVLILDEPVNHLDVYYQHQIMLLLQRLCKEQGKTVIVTLHDINLAATYCDALMLLHRGNVKAWGSVESVLQQSYLEEVFRLSCFVQKQSNGMVRVDFCPSPPAQTGETK